MPHALMPLDDSMPALVNRKIWKRDQYKFIRQVGVIRGPHELMSGFVLDKSGASKTHNICVCLLLMRLMTIFGGNFVRCRQAVEVSENDRELNCVEPNLAVLNSPVTEFSNQSPGPGNVVLVAEVSDMTLQDDLTTKMQLYARAGVAEYWVLDVTSRRLIVHRQPQNGTYDAVSAFLDNEEVSTLAAPLQFVRVADLLPPVLPS